MNFAPADPKYVLHDTWVFLHVESVHLFYLAMEVGNNSHRLIGHAVSRDWLRWEELPYIELTGNEGEWDAGRVGTGHTWQGDDGRFYMAYTGRIDPQEDVGLAVSDDLVVWRKAGAAPVWPQALEAPYESDFEERGVCPAWRDPFVTVLPDGKRYAFLCAKRQHQCLVARPCVAVGLIGDAGQWTTLPPLRTPSVFPTMEVPEVFELGGRWWLTFNAGGGWGRRIDTGSREVSSGSYYLVADEPFGEWRLPPDCLLIGSGQGRRDAVVARSVVWHGERLVYHHYTGSGEAGSARALGLPKVTEVEGEGLVLRPWSGLAGLHRATSLGNWTSPARGPFSSGTWREEDGCWVGCCAEGAAMSVADAGTGDLDVSCGVQLRDAGRVGFGVAGGTDGQGAFVVLLDGARRRAALCQARGGAFGPVLDPALDALGWEVPAVGVVQLRIVKRSRYLDAYLDDRLVFCTVLPSAGSGRHITAVVEDGGAAFRVRELHGVLPFGQG